ncbi:Ribosomal protein arginine N-methyltransferase rmt3 [Conoideocrella luteorostrata]|uniref:type I protein arginine methyltransferase n=1 Tax=Conoideocrella luteorostrata TaxID=1105319 RepID=A0AAJ0CTE5_9HYPO|nr:Ribosomal protein arginine N-methyltransferase rmt3 [Conoideocrella luteorostrata]
MDEPPPPPSQDSDTSEESQWLDIEPDTENISVASLFDAQTFPTLPEMLEHCKQQHNFDLRANLRRLQLDFFGAVKLVNYIRHHVQNNSALPKQILPEDIEDERYLKPVLENDAVIFSLDEILESLGNLDTADAPASELLARNKSLEAELESIRESFANYRLTVEQTLDQRWGVDDGPTTPLQSKKKDSSGYYFESYAAQEIHETMLKDSVRTDAYRDFIYENKHIFKNKVVLDLGCGTGILSMFCAKAGATCVIAVDKSDIIDKARENIFNNDLSEIITCVKGGIEDVALPVKEVDIIVSEWMGYCLLYEAMLPSVLYARDKYLKPDGLLVPSSATLWIAPVKDEAYLSEHISYWRDVYGFDMKAMQERIYDEVRVEAMPKSSLCGEPFPFKVLDLYSTRPEDLSFTADWSAAVGDEITSFHGFLVWFDNFFSPSRTNSLPEASTTPAAFRAAFPGNVAFTTGPDGAETHWKQGLLLSTPEQLSQNIPASRRLAGKVAFSVHSDNARALSLRVTWSTEHGGSSQDWELK